MSPIQNPVHSTLVQPSFSEHADISDKHNALKLNLYSDDLNSDESDYEDNIPLKLSKKDIMQWLGSPLFVGELETQIIMM